MSGIIIVFLLFGSVLSKPVNNDVVSEEKSSCNKVCPPVYEDKLNVHIVCHSHDDVGWLKTVDQYYYGTANDIQQASVQNIIDSVVAALMQNPERKFIQVETAFFHKWWKRQNEQTRETVRQLVINGQLEIVGGAWSMNDEGASHYQSIIDQFTLGLRVINETVGECGRPTVGWQIDPFGHSSEMASIFARMGFDGLFFARLDWRDKTKRLLNNEAEMLWKPSGNLGNESNLFTSVLYNHYSAPPGFCFDTLCKTNQIVDDENSAEYNYEDMVVGFATFLKTQADNYLTNNIIITMGDDFHWADARSYYKNVDLLIKGFKKFPQYFGNKEINVFYSTPSCYLKAVNNFTVNNSLQMPTKLDDFFPYATDYHAYWSGYFTSRPTTKRFERQGNNLLQVGKQIGVYSKLTDSDSDLNVLKEAVGIMQHHDAITGTEKQNVANDYMKILTEAVDKTINKSSSQIVNLLKKTNGEHLQFSSCLLSNVSHCPISNKHRFVVAVYNPLSRNSSELIRLPVDQITFNITGPNNEQIPYQILPSISDFNLMQDINPSKYNLVFKANNVPAHGLKLYYFQTIQTEKKYIPKPDESTMKNTIGNDDLGATINNITGILESITINRRKLSVSQRLMYYVGALGNNIIFENRSSGAYIFRPDPEIPNATSFEEIVNFTTYKGDLVDEIHQTFSSWAKQIIRVYKNEKYVEFDWLVGPIDVDDINGKEVISRFTTNVTSGDLFFTDSNGREMMKRRKDYRETYEYTNEEPIAGNYYPVTSKIVIKNDTENIDFAVVNDRSQGGSSLESGMVELMWQDHFKFTCILNRGYFVARTLNAQDMSHGFDEYFSDFPNSIKSTFWQSTHAKFSKYIQSFHYLYVANRLYRASRFGYVVTKYWYDDVPTKVHRRLLHDDAFGVGEALDEYMYGTGLIVRGQHYVTFGPIFSQDGETSAKTQRILQQRKLLEPWIFLADVGDSTIEEIQTGYNFHFAGLKRSLPENVHILTLEPWNTSRNEILIRLEHIFELNEDPILSQPVTVDLIDLFEKFTIDSLMEMTLDGNLALNKSTRLPLNSAKINREDANLLNLQVTLNSMQIRTFVASVRYL